MKLLFRFDEAADLPRSVSERCLSADSAGIDGVAPSWPQGTTSWPWPSPHQGAEGNYGQVTAERQLSLLCLSDGSASQRERKLMVLELRVKSHR